MNLPRDTLGRLCHVHGAGEMVRPDGQRCGRVRGGRLEGHDLAGGEGLYVGVVGRALV